MARTETVTVVFTSAELAAGRAEAEELGMAREIVRFDRLSERLSA